MRVGRSDGVAWAVSVAVWAGVGYLVGGGMLAAFGVFVGSYLYTIEKGAVGLEKEVDSLRRRLLIVEDEKASIDLLTRSFNDLEHNQRLTDREIERIDAHLSELDPRPYRHLWERKPSSGNTPDGDAEG